MSADADKRLTCPILVNEECLLRLDEAFRDTEKRLAKGIAHHFDIKRDQYLRYSDAGKVPKTVNNAERYEHAITRSRLNYKIKWQNGVSATFFDIEEALGALRREYSEPISVEGEVGVYPGSYASVSIRKLFDQTASVVVRCSLEDIQSSLSPLVGVLRNSSPEYPLLHRSGFKSALVGIGYCALLIGVGVAGWGAAEANSVSGFGLALLFFLLFLGMSGIVAKLYTATFPPVVFEFGAGRRHAARKRLFAATFVLLVTTVIGFTVSWSLT